MNTQYQDIVTRLKTHAHEFQTDDLIRLVRTTYHYSSGRACYICPLAMEELYKRGVLPRPTEDTIMRNFEKRGK